MAVHSQRRNSRTRRSARRRGSFATAWRAIGGAFLATAMSKMVRAVAAAGLVGGTLFAVVTATSASGLNSYSINQCANGGKGTTVACSGSAYQSGDDNGSNSHWAEGDTLPFQLTLFNITPGPHTVALQYQTVDKGKHSYDYLGSFNATETTGAPTALHANNNNPCGGIVAGCDPAHPTATVGIPAPTLSGVNGTCGSAGTPPTLASTTGVFSLWGPTGTLFAPINAVTYASPLNQPANSGCVTVINVSFISPAGNPTLVLAWGAHIASEFDWGPGNGAGAISGAPYHMWVNSLDGSGGSQERSLQSSAIVAQPALATVVETSSNTPVPLTGVVVGTTVHDTATLSGAAASASGTVTYKLYSGACGTGTLLNTTTGTVANGVIGASGPFTVTTPGSYCYLASYGGDVLDAATTAAPENFTVFPASPTITTTVKDAQGNTVDNNHPAPLGSVVHDTASLTNAYNATGATVTYTLYGNNICDGIAGPTIRTDQVTVQTGNVVPDSPGSGALGAGSYSYQAVMSANTTNNKATGLCEPFKISKAPIAPVTQPFNAVTNSPWSSGSTGATAYDTATLTGIGSFTPTGTVSYQLFDNGTCTAPADTTYGTSTVTIAQDGSVPNSATTQQLASGNYGFLATYHPGTDPNYTAGTPTCEPFSVGRVSTTTATTIRNIADNSVINSGSSVPLGTSVNDTATVTPVGGQTAVSPPSGNVVFKLYSGITVGTDCTSGTQINDATVGLNGGSATWTPSGQPLNAGTYAFQATYVDDSSYIGSTGPCEFFTINKANAAATTTVVDAATTQPWSSSGELAPGSAYDTVSVTKATGTLAGAPAPAGAVVFQLFASSDCTTGLLSTSSPVTLVNGAAKSPTTSGLLAGSYGYLATYQGNVNYNSQPASCEPFTVTQPNVAAVKSVSPDPNLGPVYTGTVLTYTITLTNTGNGPANNVVVTDNIPAGTTYHSGGTPVGSNPVTAVTFHISSIAANGGTASVSYSVTVNSNDADGQTIPNFATFTVNEGCAAIMVPCTTNTVITEVGVPNIQVGKQNNPTGSVTAGKDTILYTLVVTNSGLLDSPPVTVKDTIPAGTTYVAGSATPASEASYDAATNTITWTIPVVHGLYPSGIATPVSLSFTVSVNASDPNGFNIPNFGVFDGANSSGCTLDVHVEGFCDTNTVNNPVVAPIVSAQKSSNPADGSTVPTGTVVTYTIALTNAGGAAATETVTDAVPAGTTFKSAANSGTYDSATNTVTWSNVTVPANTPASSAVTVSFTVTVNTSDAGGTTIPNHAIFDNANTPQTNCVQSTDTTSATCDTNTVRLIVATPPPVVTQPAPQVAPTTTTTVAKHALAFTGLNAKTLGILAMALVGGGTILVLIGRRRRPNQN